MKNIDLKKILFILLVICVMPLGVEAADLKLKSNTTINYSPGGSIFPSFNNEGIHDGYVYFAYDGEKYLLLKYDLEGNKIFKKFEFNGDDWFSNLNVEDIDSNSDYDVKGESDVLITVLDDNGDVVFEKQYGGNGFDVKISSIYSYNDKGDHDGYLIAIQTNSSDLGVAPGFIMIKYDLKGNLVFEKNINDNFNTQGFRFILHSNEQKVDLVFSFSDNTQILKLDPDTGESISNVEPGFNIYSLGFSYKDGVIDGVIVIGYDSANKYGYIAKYDLDLNEVFKISTGVSENVLVKSSRLPDGTYDGYIVSIVTDEGTSILKYDLNGKQVFKTLYSKDKCYFDLGMYYNYNSFGDVIGYTFIGVLPFDDMKLVQVRYDYSTNEISKTSSDNGTILVNNEATAGETVKVNVYPKDGYFVKRIIVKDESGKEIVVSNDGTFVMPEGKVVVSAIYERITNPDTKSALAKLIQIIGLLIVAGILVRKVERQVS